jgi:hypothetical protein
MTFGRPAAIPDSYIKLELPVELDTPILPLTPADPRKHPSVQFFNATMYIQMFPSKMIRLITE